MSTHDEIRKKVNDWYEEHPAGIAKFVESTRKESNADAFEKLKDFVEYVELYGLKEILPESYIQAKYQLKELVLKNDAFDYAEKELAFYDWLKICINPQREVNYDFYFEKNKLDKEEEVRSILFEEDGKGRIRDIFTKDDWQIRLRTIADWFLKRYDIATARKIYDFIRKPYKSCFDNVRLCLPRLIGAIFIGFLPLIAAKDIWELPLKLGLFWTIVISFLSTVFAYLYLTAECYNVIKKRKMHIREQPG